MGRGRGPSKGKEGMGKSEDKDRGKDKDWGKRKDDRALYQAPPTSAVWSPAQPA